MNVIMKKHNYRKENQDDKSFKGRGETYGEKCT